MQIHIYIYTCIYMQNAYWHKDKGWVKTSLENIYLSIYLQGFEKVIQGFTVRGSWRPNRNCNIFTPLLCPSALCLSRSLDAQPEARGLTLLAFSTTSYQQLLWTPTHQGPKGPLRRLLYYILSSNSSTLQLSLTVLTELYNSSTSTQSPTQSLEWHVWSSSSGNNCHAVQRSLSSGASVYECIMGFFPCPILLAKSIYAIFPHKCHRNVSLPSGASPWNGIFGRVEGQNRTHGRRSKIRLSTH